MTATVEQLIKKSLKLIVVAGDEASIPAIESQDYIFSLNNLVALFESDSNVDLTWTTVTSVSDTLGCPDGMIGPLATLMAVEIAPEYGITPQPDLYLASQKARGHILRQATTIPTTKKPETLPKGQGNQDFVFWDSPYYSGSE